jgi:hypothetical protein
LTPRNDVGLADRGDPGHLRRDREITVRARHASPRVCIARKCRPRAKDDVGARTREPRTV